MVARMIIIFSSLMPLNGISPAPRHPDMKGPPPLMVIFHLLGICDTICANNSSCAFEKKSKIVRL